MTQLCPPPTTFAEGQRRLYGLAVGAAGVCIGLAIVTGAAIVAFGDWGKDQLHFQLIILFALLGGGMVIISFVIIGLLLGGPVGKFNTKLSDGTRTLETNAEAQSQ
jgi:fucose permease